ncbi:MAG: hypothetical protein ABSG17_21885 [Spirochaetia bacterium]|jgi:hypothetical protein
MNRLIVFLGVFALLVLACMPLAAQAENPVGLGISLGAAVAEGTTSNIANPGGSMSFNWGFYVNIPLLYTFHITPSSELYKIQDQNATDIDLAFKFIVPLSTLAVYAGFVPGLTAISNVLDLHIGVLGGVTFPLISNLDLFLQAKYNILFDGGQNMQIIHANAGILFKF